MLQGTFSRPARMSSNRLEDVSVSLVGRQPEEDARPAGPAAVRQRRRFCSTGCSWISAVAYAPPQEAPAPAGSTVTSSRLHILYRQLPEKAEYESAAAAASVTIRLGNLGKNVSEGSIGASRRVGIIGLVGTTAILSSVNTEASRAPWGAGFSLPQLGRLCAIPFDEGRPGCSSTYEVGQGGVD